MKKIRHWDRAFFWLAISFVVLVAGLIAQGTCNAPF